MIWMVIGLPRAADGAVQTFAININQRITNGVPAIGAGNIEAPGDSDHYTFTGSAGDRLFFDELSGEGCSTGLKWKLQAPDQSILFDEFFAAVEQCGSGGDAGVRVLPKSGSYTLTVYSDPGKSGIYSFQIFSAVPQTFTLQLDQTVTNNVPASGAGILESPGAIDVYKFNATAGQRVYFDEMTGIACSSGIRWSLANPSGVVIFDEVFATVEQCGLGGDAGLMTLTNAGEYTLTVYGRGDATGSYAFRVNTVVDQSFNIAIDQTISKGVPQAGAGSIETPGARDFYSFQAISGQQVYFDEMTGIACTSGLRWRLETPSKQVLFDEVFATVEQCGLGGDAGLKSLPETGTYRITVYGVADTISDYAFHIYPVAVQSFPISIDQTISKGVPQAGAGSIETPGTQDLYSFQAIAGQQVYFDEMTGFACTSGLRWRLESPSKQVLFDEVFAAVDQCGLGGDAGLKTLPETGAYQITVYGVADATSDYAFHIYPVVVQSIPISINQTITNGIPSAGAGNIENPAAQDHYTFHATAGQSLYFDELTGFGCVSGLRWKLEDPANKVIFDQVFAAVDQCGSGGDAGVRVMPATGTYLLTVYGVTDFVGPYAFRIDVIQVQNFDIAVDQPVSTGVPSVGAGSIESPGNQDIYHFSGTKGQKLYFDEQTGLGCSSGLRWRLEDPTKKVVFDEVFAALDQCGSGGDAGLRTLSASGLYTITVYGVADTVSDYAFEIFSVQAQSFPLAIGDQVTNGIPALGAGNIETPGATDVYTFTATAGQRVYFDEQSGAGCESRFRWRLVDSAQQVLFDDLFAALEQCESGPDVGLLTLTNGGAYILTVYGVADAVGTYRFQIFPAEPEHFALELGQIVTNGVPAVGAGRIGTPGNLDLYSFTASTGQAIYMDALTGNGCTSVLFWELMDPKGKILSSNLLADILVCSAGGDIGKVVLPMDGTYTVQVGGIHDGVGDYSIAVWPVAPPFLAPMEDRVVPEGGILNVELVSTASNPRGYPLKIRLVSGPSGAQVDPKTGVLQWTAPSGVFQDFAFTVAVQDALGGETQGTIHARVVAAIDLAVQRLEVPASVVSDETFPVKMEDKNRGSQDISGSWTDRLWLSSDAVLDNGDELVGTFNVAGPLKSGQSASRTVAVQAPHLPGRYYLIAQLDTENTIAESNESNNTFISAVIEVSPEYSAVVSTDLERALSGVPVVLKGHATKARGGPAALKSVDVAVRTRGTTRLLTFTTDAAGDFTGVFRPLLGEAGEYTVGAAPTGLGSPPIQDTFQLIGMGFTPNTLPIQIEASSSQDFTAVLKSRSQVSLAGLKANVKGLDGSIPLSISVDVPSVLVPDGTAVVTLHLKAGNSQGLGGTSVVEVSSTEGALAQLTLNWVIQPVTAHLAVKPTNLARSMLRGAQSTISFDVQNLGTRPSGPIQVLLPNVGWLKVANALPVPSLAAGENVTVALVLQPDASLPLGIHEGSIVVTDGTSTSIRVPYQFTCVSDLLSELTVEVVDELTYYADGSPKVSGAKVQLRDHGTLNVITNGVTGNDGRIHFSSIQEGYYDVEVDAAKHSTFRGTTLVQAGTNNFVQTFLTYEAVRYEFTVVPATIEDKTHVTINTVFETVVPIPVVTIEPNQIDLTQIQSPRTEIELHITNHGLVAAQEMKLGFAGNSKWRFTPLQSELGDLAARSSIVVPLVIERLDLLPPPPVGGVQPAPAPTLADGGGGDCGLSGSTCWSLICGKSKNGYCAPIFIGGPCYGGGGSYLPPRYPGAGGEGLASFVPPICQCVPTPCDPCANKITSALFEFGAAGVAPLLFPVLGPVGVCINDGRKCYNELSTCANGGECNSRGAGLSCLAASLSCGVIVAVGAGFGAAEAPLAIAGLIVGMAGLGDDIANACKEGGKEGSSGGAGAPAPPVLASTDPTFFPGQAKVKEEADRLHRVIDAYIEIFGDPAWLHAKLGTNFVAFISAFQTAVDEQSAEGLRISPAERISLLSGKLPELVTSTMVQTFLDRWNRTEEYYSKNIYLLKQVPVGASIDFIALDSLVTKWNAASQAIAELDAEGHPDDLLGGMRDAIQTLIGNLSSSSGGVCARVRLQLDQDAVVTRAAFNAKLELSNNANEPLTGLKVQLQVFDINGSPATPLFGILPPSFDQLNAVDGSGVVDAGTTGSASWLIVPGHNAAPSPNPEVYYVGGTFSYVQQGKEVRVPLTPAPITVYPTPRLSLTYFHERDVLGDDPFTPAIESSVPYSLGVLVKNSGFGKAKAVNIVSSQPKIIENEKGLLIDFDLIGTEIAGEAFRPTLTADFGDIDPSEIKIGRWLFTSSLQGQFIDYQATFENVGPLKDFPELATIDQVSIHEMKHIVRAEGPGLLDDGKPDFLVNDIQDDHFLPDTLYLSDGSTQAVSVVQSALADGTPTDSHLSVGIHTEGVPAGWVYFDFPDPSTGSFQLVSVARADGSKVRFGENAWTTDRTFIAGGRRPTYERRIHLFDRVLTGGAVDYTLTYALSSSVDHTPPTSSMIQLPVQSSPSISVQWLGGDNAGGSGLAFFDVYVSEDGGPFSLWLGRTSLTGAIYEGQTGHRYGFYTVATDQAGNVEVTPSTPDTSTSVGLGNARPQLQDIPTQTLDEGSSLRLSISATDADLPGDHLTFSLGEGAPLGMVLDPDTGLLTWVTGEGNGPSTNVVTIHVQDTGTPPLSDIRSFRVVVREVNSPPTIDPIPAMIVNEGDLVRFTIPGTDFDIPAQSLRYRLISGAPRAMSLNEVSGNVRWQTTELDGPATNTVVVQVSDGIAAAQQSFQIIVRDTRGDFQLGMGDAVVPAGGLGLLPISLSAAVDLVSLQFRLDLPAGRFADLSLGSLSSLIGTLSIQPVGVDQYLIQIAALPGQVLQLSNTIANLQFTAGPLSTSASLFVTPEDLKGFRASGELLQAPRAITGQVVIVGTDPVLRVEATQGQITLFGKVGDHILIEGNSSLESAGGWRLLRDVQLSTPVQQISLDPLTGNSTTLFIRARRP